MLGLCLSRIIATLIHRAFFLLLADFFAGARWYLINNFTAFIDFALGTDYELFMSYQDMRFALTALGTPTMVSSEMWPKVIHLCCWFTLLHLQ